MRELLMEIGTEDLPASFMDGALTGLGGLLEEAFKSWRIAHGRIDTFGTMRRLVAHVEEVAERQEDARKKVVGPPVKAAFDPSGKPTKAALGFARAHGIEVGDLQREETPRGECLCLVKAEKGQETSNLLKQILPDVILKLPFPRSMRWAESEVRFARPIHWIVALFGGDVIDFELAGVEAGDVTYGHRFLAPDPIVVKDFESYLLAMERAKVVVGPDERRRGIREMVSAASRERGGRAIIDEELLGIVNNMVECPSVTMGGFEEEFLSLPREVLVTSMAKHQKYFAVEDEKGKLLPYFVAVNNILVEDDSQIRSGNERVLRARLSDAMFFYQEDRKRPLSHYISALKSVVFESRLGTYYEKVERICQLTSHLAGIIAPDCKGTAERAARLCKADLETQMVYEFPELQGVMGREYALASGEDEEVAQAIYDHYLPRYADDALPESTAGAVVGIADRLDTVVGCFGVGLIPTGSEDPYALRRQSLAIILIVINREKDKRELRFSLYELINRSLDLLSGKISRDPQEVKNEVISFFCQRLQSLFTSIYRYDFVDAVLAAGIDDLLDVQERIEALKYISEKEDFPSLVATFKRVVNILPPSEFPDVSNQLLIAEEEKKLFERYSKVRSSVETFIEIKEYASALLNIATLKKDVDNFFDNVLVMDEDRDLRTNRFALLARIAALFEKIADFKRIVIEGEQKV